MRYERKINTNKKKTPLKEDKKGKEVHKRGIKDISMESKGGEIHIDTTHEREKRKTWEGEEIYPPDRQARNTVIGDARQTFFPKVWEFRYSSMLHI